MAALIAILPFEIWDHILSYCTFWDKMRFRQICKSALRLKITKLPHCFYYCCTSDHFKRLNSKIINKLTDLKTLIIPEFENEKCRNYLSNLTYLTQLVIEKHKSITLPAMNLYDLKLDSVRNIYGLNLQTRLTHLILNGVVNFKKFDFQFLLNLRRLKMRQCFHINWENFSLLTNLQSLDISGGGYSELYVNNLTNLVELNPDAQNIQKIDGLTNLTSLLSTHKLDDKKFLNIIKLNKLYLNSPGIYNLSNLKQLEELHIVYDMSLDLTDDGITDLTKLTKLFIFGSKIRKIGHLTNLKELQLVSVPIKNEELKSLTKLESLVLGFDTAITDITHLTNLTNLKSTNNIKNHQLKLLNKLQRLDCEKGIKNIENLINLTSLHIYPGLEEESLRALTNLQDVTFHCNNFEHLKYLSNITRLETNHHCTKNAQHLLFTRLTNLQIIRNCRDPLVHQKLRDQKRHIIENYDL